MVELFQSKEKWFGDIYGSETEKVENGVYEVANKIKVRAQEIGIRYDEHEGDHQNGNSNGIDLHNGEKKRRKKSVENKDFSSSLIYILETHIFEINIFYQDLYRNLGFFENFFDLLEYDVETFVDDNTSANPQLIKKIYSCLALAAKKNLVNKWLFNKYLKTVIVPHLKCEQELHTHL